VADDDLQVTPGQPRRAEVVQAQPEGDEVVLDGLGVLG